LKVQLKIKKKVVWRYSRQTQKGFTIPKTRIFNCFLFKRCTYFDKSLILNEISVNIYMFITPKILLFIY